MKEKIIATCAELKDLIDGIGTIQTATGLIVSGTLIVLFVLCVLGFTKKINKATKTQIERFQRDGKYLPAIYIELNNSMECLRYFIFSYRWKHRIIKQYNHLFRGYEGKRLKRLLGPNAKCSLSYLARFSEISSALSAMHDELDGIRNKRRELYDENGEIVWAITNSTYKHIHAIEHLQDLCAMVFQKNVILVGNAGNGKTSLMCRMSEIAIASGIPCLLVNSRDIKEDCTEHIIKRLPIPAKMRNMVPLYLRLISLLLFFRRKYFYIFIDAINENDREVFTSSIANMLETFSKYGRIRILLTCRSEYFDLRYKALFSKGEEKPYIFNLEEETYSKRAIEKMIRAYMDCYNVRGPFSLDMQNKLVNSLFLTRIFFEVNSNHDECSLEFRNAEIYKLYFEKIVSENPKVELDSIVNRIAKCMFDSFEFDRVPMGDLQLSSEDQESLRRLLDNNLIISHSIHAGTGITEREEEYVYFVFDELRDFCLARYLLTLDENKSSAEFTLFFSNATKLFAQKLSPVEGMIKYAYHYFRTVHRNDLCEKILTEFGTVDVQGVVDWKTPGLRSRRPFDNFGFSLIFSEGDNIAPFEIDYILHCIKKDCSNYWEIFWFLLRNEYSRVNPNVELAVDILLRFKDEKTTEEILEFFYADAVDQYYYSNKKRRVNALKEWLDVIEKNSGGMSKNLKVMVTILAAYAPLDYELEEYHHFVKDEEVFNTIQESDFCVPIKALVCEFKDRLTPRETDQDVLQVLIDILNSEGYCE